MKLHFLHFWVSAWLVLIVFFIWYDRKLRKQIKRYHWEQ